MTSTIDIKKVFFFAFLAIMPLVVFEGQYALHTSSYGFIEESKNILNGNWLGTNSSYPILYSFLLSIFLFFNLPIFIAAQSLGILLNFGSIILLHQICLKITKDEKSSLAASILYASWPMIQYFSIYIMSESLLIASLLVSTYFLIKIQENIILERTEPFNWLMVSLPVMVKQPGYCMVLLGLFFAYRVSSWSIKKSFISVAFLSIFPILTMVRTYFINSTLTGSPFIGYKLYDPFLSSVLNYGYNIAIVISKGVEKIQLGEFKHFISFAMLISIIGLTITAILLRKRKGFFILHLPLLFCLFFSTLALIYPLDPINTRYTILTIPFFIISLTLISSSFEKTRKMILGIASLSFLLNFATSAYIMVKDHNLPDANYSPSTLLYIENQIPPSDEVYLNIYGKQATVFSKRQNFKGIPFENQFTKKYTSVELLKENSFSELIRKKTVHLIFFMGSRNKDPLLERKNYGDLVDKIIQNPKSLNYQIKKTKLVDGLVITVKEKENESLL